MLNLDHNILAKIITEAKANAAAHPRWISAIARAAQEMESNPWIEAQDDHTLLIGSPSGSTYIGNGSCQCTAFSYGLPCWHRAAARLYHRYVEAEAAKPAPAPTYVCKGCGERTETRGLCYACVTRGPVVEQVYSNRVQRQIAAARAKAQIDELFA